VGNIKMEVMIGNYSIARGLVEAGLELAAAYPGTPSSEIIPGIIEFNKREGGHIHAEWSTNERCAFEVAFGAALTGKKAACMMKQVGLNVAFPSFLSARRKRIKGGLVIICCDDPGPQSSQTEQDTRLIATLMGVTVFDPCSPREAGDVAYHAMEYSYKHKVPVVVRPTHRVSHARENIGLYKPGTRKVVLNEGIFLQSGGFGTHTKGLKDGIEGKVGVVKPSDKNPPPKGKFGIVASGMTFSITADVVHELNMLYKIPIYKVIKINPVEKGLFDFVDSLEKILVLEETDIVLESVIHRGNKVFGRKNGYVPAAGELTYDTIRDIIERLANETGLGKSGFSPDISIENSLKEITFTPRPPTLCAGCPHRSAFFAMKHAFPDAIFPGDIGCYTLGISMGAVDTCIDMGGGVDLASGFYKAFSQDGKFIPIIASIGDSTFFHAGLEPLYDARLTGKRFILVIMDNSTTAMTGMQPTPQSGITADGTKTHSINIQDVVKAFGVDFLRIIDPYDIPLLIETLKEAYNYLASDNNLEHKPAMIITKRECILSAKTKPDASSGAVDIEQNCIGCKVCTKYFDCPALVFDNEKQKITIDEGLCIKCGLCLVVCSMKRPSKKAKK